MNSVLDLLSVVGKLGMAGETSFDVAASVASGGITDGYLSKFLRRDLEGLGHIRCIFGKVRQVHVLAPRFCLLPEGTPERCRAVLAGARTKQFEAEFDYLCVAAGLSYSRLNLENGLPQRILLEGPYEALSRVAEKLCIDVGTDPSIPDAWRLLHGIESLNALLRTLTGSATGYQDVPAPLQGLHIYNPGIGSFILWEHMSQNYASELLLIRKTPYDYRLAQKTIKDLWRLHLAPLTVDPRWAMWAVRQADKTLGASLPRPNSWTLRMPTACSLPTELHQVAILCSGLPPKRNGAFFEYVDVPPIIQHSIHQKLSIGEISKIE